MTYHVLKDTNDYVVVELQDDGEMLELKRFGTQKEAQSFVRHLKFGGGFNGFTPQFMGKKYVESAASV